MVIIKITQTCRIAIAILITSLASTQRIIESDMIVNPNADASNYSFLSLGDSYTIGESVSETYRWSVQLAEMLRKDGEDVGNPDIIARTGWTTAELQNAIKASGNQKTYTLVSLLIGVNNQYRGQSQDQYRTEFRELLQTAIKFAGGKATHVFVLSIPDWGVSPYAAGQNKAKISQEIDQFNAIAKDECQKMEIVYVDITPISRAAKGDDTQFASDGLHYSGKQMKQWAEKALPVVKESLKK
jgi:lysophospholipase L1-like esterase